MFDAKGREGSSMVDLEGAIYLGGAYLLYLDFYVSYMHSCLLLCIELHKCDRNRDINVIVIFM